MIIKFPDCGIEHSYSRNLRYVCSEDKNFFDRIFKETEKAYQWNYDTELSIIDTLLKEFNSYEDLLEIISEKKNIKIEENLQVKEDL